MSPYTPIVCHVLPMSELIVSVSHLRHVLRQDMGCFYHTRFKIVIMTQNIQCLMGHKVSDNDMHQICNGPKIISHKPQHYFLTYLHLVIKYQPYKNTILTVCVVCVCVCMCVCFFPFEVLNPVTTFHKTYINTAHFRRK